MAVEESASMWRCSLKANERLENENCEGGAETADRRPIGLNMQLSVEYFKRSSKLDELYR
jgi:hypothetical protein